MTRIDTYILRALAGPFLFFVLVFTGVVWLSQSLRVIDTIVNNGQSAAVFLEISALLLPTVLSIVLPIATFAGTLYAINRLVGDSEVVVMFAAGLSGHALLRPVVIFGAAATAMLGAVTLYLLPVSKSEMQARLYEMRGDVAAAFLREGAFVSPMKGLTVYLREQGRAGEMLGVFVHDERDEGRVVTYTAQRAILAQDSGSPHLVMFDGLAQTTTPGKDGVRQLSLLGFERLSYDLGQLAGSSGPPPEKPSEKFLPTLLGAGAGETGRHSLGDYRAEGHEALSAPLYALALPLLGAALVVSAAFRRHGLFARIAFAAAIGIGLRIAGLAFKAATSAEAALWPLLYVPPVAAIAAALWLMRLPVRRPRARPAGAEAA